MSDLGTLVYSLGVLGSASCLFWLAAVVCPFLPTRAPHRTARLWQMLGLLLLAYWLADARFMRVSRMRTDQSAELAAAAERKEKLEAAPEPPAAAGLVSTGAQETAETARPRPSSRAYRAGGKVERTAGKEVKDKALDTIAKKTEKESVEAERMRSAELHRAKHWSRLNRRLVIALIWAALGVIAVDYLRRLNTTAEAYFPLPIAGTWLEVLRRRSRVVSAPPCSPDSMRRYLEQLVRKGETFVYFGDRDPWQDAPPPARHLFCFDRSSCLPRLVLPDPRPFLVRTWSLLTRRARPPVAGRPFEFLPLARVTYTDLPPGDIPDETLESAWFRRYCFVVLPGAATDEWLDALEDFFMRRQLVLAAARRAVNVVWDTERGPEDNQLRELVFLCRETDCRLTIVRHPSHPASLPEEAVDEHVALNSEPALVP